MGVWTLLTRFRLSKALDHDLLRRLLLRLHFRRPLKPDHLFALRRLYDRATPWFRLEALEEVATPEALADWWLLEADFESQLGQDALQVLTKVAQRSTEQHRAVLRHLRENIHEADPNLWRPSIDKLYKIDSPMALAVAREELHAGWPDPLFHCLRRVVLPIYASSLQDLTRLAPEHRSAIIKYLRSEFDQREPEFATCALIVMDTFDAEILPRLLAKRRTDTNARDPLDILATGFPKLLPRERADIVNLLRRGVLHADELVWRPCLTALLNIKPATALSICRERLQTGDSGLIEHLLDRAPPPMYDVAIRALADAADSILLPKRPALLRRIARQALGRASPHAGLALAALTTLQPHVAGEVFALRRADGVLPHLLSLADQGAKQREKVLIALRPALQLPDTSDVTERLSDLQKPLADLLFPRVERLAEPQEAILHLHEALIEPETYVAGVRISVWIYRQQGQISDIAVAGHATPEVCRAVTGRLIDALLACGRSIDERAFLATGVFLLRVSPAERASDTLEALEAALRQLAEQTGLIQIHEVGQPTYGAIVDQLRSQIEQSVKTGRSLVLYAAETSGSPSAVLLPFYLFGAGGLRPLSFDLPLALLGGPEFDTLFNQQGGIIDERVTTELQRRREVYQIWLEQDQARIRQYSIELFTQLLPTYDSARRDKLAAAYSQLLASPGHLRSAQRKLYEAARQALPQLGLPPVGEQSEEQIAHIVPRLVRSLSLADRLAYGQDIATDLQTWIEARAPGVALPIADWPAALRSLTPPNAPIQRRRNYPEAIVETSFEPADEPTPLLELIEIGLPAFIALDRHWIAAIDRQIGQADQTQKRQILLNEINFSTMIDPFLRGWPPVFLDDRKRRGAYERWSATRRSQVWDAIRQQLLERGARADPLAADNVVFTAYRMPNDTIRITPYFVTSNHEYAVLIHPQVGMTWYLYPWQYRDCQPERQQGGTRTACQQALDDAEQALAAGDTTSAVDLFRHALCTHPIQALDEILDRASKAMWADTRTLFEEFLPLAEAVEDFTSEYALPSREILTAFLERYPAFMAEPYLLQALLDDREAKRLQQMGSELRGMVRRQKQRILQFDALQVLVQRELGENPSTYSLGIFINALCEQEIISRSVVQQPLGPVEDMIRKRTQAYQETLCTIWHRLWETHDRGLRQAIQLGIAQADLFRVGGYRASPAFERHFTPILAYQRARTYLSIEQLLKQSYETLDQLLGEGQPKFDMWQKPEDRQPLVTSELASLRMRLLTALSENFCEPQVAMSLQRLWRQLQGYGVTASISRESIRDALASSVQLLAARAYELLDQASSTAPEFSVPRQQLAQHMYYLSFYKLAVQLLIGDRRAPLLSSLQAERYSILDTRRGEVSALRFDRSTQTIFMQTDTDEEYAVLRIEGLAEDDMEYLCDELSRPYVVELMNPSEGRLTPAYALLLTPLNVPPRVTRWCDTLSELLPWLVLALAYFGPSAPGEAERESASSKYDDAPVVECVKVSLTCARDRVAERLIGSAPELYGV
jgi:hypothetical protein